MTEQEVDWAEWRFFLEMLSAERVEPFVDELRLPFGRQNFREVMRLARACLEIDMWRAASIAEGNPELPGFYDAWLNYRSSEGVLSGAELELFSARFKSPESAPLKVYFDLGYWIGTDLANELLDWFFKRYRSSPDPSHKWPWALRELVANAAQKAPTHPTLYIPDEARQKIVSFCTLYYAKRRDLEMRFYVISQAATATLPTAWEAVLQTFPAGGLGNRYPWLGRVGQCLQYKLLLTEWRKLKKALGPNTLAGVIDWVKQNENLLPLKTHLTDLPELTL